MPQILRKKQQHAYTHKNHGEKENKNHDMLFQQKNQAVAKKIRYSLYSSCCSTDF